MTSLSELHSYISEELQKYDIDFLLHQSSLRKCTRVITNDYINKQKRINSITLVFLHWLHENCNNRIQESSLSVKKDPYKLSPSRYCLRWFHCNCNDKIIINYLSKIKQNCSKRRVIRRCSFVCSSSYETRQSGKTFVPGCDGQ